MAYTLTANISIGSLSLSFAHKVEIDSDLRKISDTCNIVLPTQGVVRQGDTVQRLELAETFKVGDAVTVRIGYNGNNVEEFSGYIARIKAKVPLELECEDEMWQLKRQKVANQAFTGTLKALVEKIAPLVRFSADFPEISLKNFIIRDATVAQVLQKIKENYLLAVYFTGKELYCGLPYLQQSRAGITSNFAFQSNIVSDNLEFRRKEDVKIKAKAISLLSNNTKLEAEVGDADGEQRTLNYRNIQSVAALRKIAEEDLRKLKFDGYKGSFVAFGLPSVRHSENVRLSDPKYAEREGRYVIESVKKTWGVSGYRQNVTIGFRTV